MRSRPLTKAARLSFCSARVALVGHLPVQDLDGVEAHLGGEVDALLDVAQFAF